MTFSVSSTIYLSHRVGAVAITKVAGKLIVRDFNLNMATGPARRQPHPDPNIPSYGKRSWGR
jgi:hypothetical protein